MTSTRTARLLSAVAALPLTLGVLGGTAHAVADFADEGSNGAVVGNIGSGVGGNNTGNSAPNQQVATGPGASNENTTAQVDDSGLTAINQPSTDLVLIFGDV